MNKVFLILPFAYYVVGIISYELIGGLYGVLFSLPLFVLACIFGLLNLFSEDEVHYV